MARALAACSFLTMFFGFGVMVHQVPILLAAGVTNTNAAYLASLAGAAAFIGKLTAGWMMDRLNAGVVDSLISFGSGLGPVVAGAIYDHGGSYAPFLWGGAAGSLLSGILIVGLGPAPVWARVTTAP